MRHLGNNVYIPDEGYKYITNGEVYAVEIRLGVNQSVDDWHDTNEEPPEPEEELTAEEALDVITGGADDETE